MQTASSKSEQVLTTFGSAMLVLNSEGRVELRGGTKEERQDAVEWISLFLPEVNVRMIETTPLPFTDELRTVCRM